MKNTERRIITISLLLISFIFILSTTCDEKQVNNDQNEADLNWAEKLGFPSGKKVIILHADDVGMCEEANIAASEYLTNDQIQSGAIMTPCPNAQEFIQWAIDHPEEDVGIHLTLTSEWKTYRWGPLTKPEEVPGLVDPDGKMWHSVLDVVMHASAEEVEKEIRAQIDMAIDLGYQPDHIDTHMGTLYGNISYMKAYFEVAEEYGIPAMVIDLSDSLVAEMFRKDGYPIDDNVIGLVDKYSLPKLDFFTSAPNGKTYEEKVNNFKFLVKSLPPGLTEIIFHPSVESDQLKSITNSWQQRVWEAEMFSDPDLINFFEDEEIIFTNWREIMKRFNENKN
ncbi:polysaccharide deacetylase family protein [Bacteroidota bacterium]